MDKDVIDHPFHEHPVILSENVDNEESLDCYGCGNEISNLERAYVCVREKACSSRIILHKRCSEFVRKIWHPSHAEHPLYLVDFRQLSWHRCNLCRRDFGRELGYRCSRCDFDLDIRCEQLGRDELLGGEARELEHPSHIHPLMLMRKPPLVFNCDACDTQDRDMAYACTVCELLIHKTCALLPALLPTNRHHHHLSLSSRFPFHHRNFEYKCAVCNKDFDLGCWVYYCGDCRYFAHLRCATEPTQQEDSNLLNQEKNEDGSIPIQFPLKACDISTELITPFVIRETGVDQIPDVNNLRFDHHKHPLSLVSELSHKDMDDDDDEVQMRICDLCVTPISSPPYYECPASACNYFVHPVCNLLPKALSSLESQLYGDCPPAHKTHKFTRYTSSESSFNVIRCSFCGSYNNGMIYECQECRMKIDVKCASLPTTIKHASHPHHRLIMTRVEEEERDKVPQCHVCSTFYLRIAYRCTNDGCDFALCLGCVLLPPSVTEQEWDKHPLLLTYDASIDHPTDFYCNFCEEEMHPKSWMYHCRPCDNSYHISCLETASGPYRNVKFGLRFEFDARLHPHPLTYNYITLKQRCDICHDSVYTYRGLECAPCNYVVCQKCGQKGLAKKM